MTKYIEKNRKKVEALILPDYSAGEEWEELPQWLSDVLGEDVIYDFQSNSYRIASGGFLDIHANPGTYLVCLGKNAYGYRLTAMDKELFHKLYEVDQ